MLRSVMTSCDGAPYPEILDRVLNTIIRLRNNCTINGHETLSHWSNFLDLAANHRSRIFVQPVRDGFGNNEPWDSFNNVVRDIRRRYGYGIFVNCKTWLRESDRHLRRFPLRSATSALITVSSATALPAVARAKLSSPQLQHGFSVTHLSRCKELTWQRSKR